MQLLTASGSTYTLVSTQKTPIVNNKMLLPSMPEGDVLFNLMIVYDNDNIVTEYDGVTTTIIGNQHYAVLNESSTISGFGVVSYLTEVI